jgi:uncharacterized protein YbbK (DUF523 family)
MNILVSACLLGTECRYNGKGFLNPAIYQLCEKHNLIPICPEQLGGLPTPRNPVEITDGKALDKEGNEYTEQFQKGAEEVLKLAKLFHCSAAILKSKSPSCGYGKIYNGTFSDILVEGNGFTANKLAEYGIKVLSENNLEDLL